jgi:accessory gene regulator protein AgrB
VLAITWGFQWTPLLKTVSYSLIILFLQIHAKVGHKKNTHTQTKNKKKKKKYTNLFLYMYILTILPPQKSQFPMKDYAFDSSLSLSPKCETLRETKL